MKSVSNFVCRYCGKSLDNDYVIKDNSTKTGVCKSKECMKKLEIDMNAICLKIDSK